MKYEITQAEYDRLTNGFAANPTKECAVECCKFWWQATRGGKESPALKSGIGDWMLFQRIFKEAEFNPHKGTFKAVGAA